ncbi:MAG: peptidyl-prolyl cis-trans isomerase [Gemmatirosa sp.]|nr:peptidyl-prolyl cis-trans isomerase [Gemmatirosa sp.]
MKRQGILVVAAIGALSACEGALTAHVDVAAKAGSQELSIERLGTLLGSAPQIPIQGPQGREVAKNVTNLWVDYQLVGLAAAKGDSLNDPKIVDDAMWAIIAMERIRKLGDVVLAKMPTGDTTNAAAKYASGELLSARHILLPFPQQDPRQQEAPGVPKAVKDSIRRKADALRAQVTPANFAQLAQKNSGDPGSAARGGDLGVFPKGIMVPAFEKAVTALQPGQISPVVETPFGYHIIYRPTYAEVAGQFGSAVGQRAKAVAESTYLKNLETSGKIEVKSDAPLWTKSIAQDIEGHLKDDKVVASSVAGELKASRVAEWITSMPQSPQLRAQIQQAPDSVVKLFVQQLARNELLLRQADSAKITLDTAATNNLRRTFVAAITGAWSGLGVTPAALKDSAKSDGDREKLAARRVEDYLDRLTQQRAQFIEIPSPIERALRKKYDYKLNDAGLDRALERAAQVRVTRDSSKAAGQPATAVPMPGATPATPAPSAPAPAAPAPGTKTP